MNGKRWNGKEKGYNKWNDKQIFEIDYIKGKKWNGKIYDEKDIIVCEIINGNGMIKEYDRDNYKSFEGEYKNGERNGKGKEYKLRYLIFEGEYLNDKRNGEGKEFEDYSQKVLFEGEYLNGKRNGKGKEFDQNNNIIFEGIYLNGKRWNGNGYDNNHNKIYELIDGNGHVIDYSNGKIKFEGYYEK